MRTVNATVALALCALVGNLAGAQPAEGDPGERRVELARLAYLDAVTSLELGVATPETVYLWSNRWLRAQREAAPRGNADAVRAHLDRMTALRADVEPLIATGVLPAVTKVALDYYVAEAEFWVAAPPPGPPPSNPPPPGSPNGSGG
jgi:hypothetical protein